MERADSEPVVSIVCSLYDAGKYLPGFLEDVRLQTIFPTAELIFIHNSPKLEELDQIEAFSRTSGASITHVRVEAVEPLPASWNRGIAAAKSPFIATWNVDDRREPDSLQKQVDFLRQRDELVGVYGDYVEVNRVGAKTGAHRSTPRFDRRQFLRSFPQGGAFTVWRRSVFDSLGGFDEQLLVGPDMEFSFRVAAADKKMEKVNGVLGYFTNEHTGLSTRSGQHPAAADRAAIQLRYAVYDKVDPALSPQPEFDVDRILANGEWHPLATYWPDAADYRKSRSFLWALGKLRYASRRLLARLGLLDFMHAIQQRLFGRDI